MNRAQLRLAIMAWLHRASFRTPMAPDFDATTGFIALAEQDMNERLRARCMVVRATEVIDAQYTPLPCDYLEMLDLRFAGGGPPVTYVPRDQAALALYNRTSGARVTDGQAGLVSDAIWPESNAWGTGKYHFSIVGSEIEWVPFPTPPAQTDGQAVQWPLAEMAYYQRIQLGPDDTDTNNVLATYPACYIFGALIFSAPFLKDDARVATWQTAYDNAVVGANTEHERSRTQGGPINQRYRRLA
jgi:hypothetical protein